MHRNCTADSYTRAESTRSQLTVLMTTISSLINQTETRCLSLDLSSSEEQGFSELCTKASTVLTNLAGLAGAATHQTIQPHLKLIVHSIHYGSCLVADWCSISHRRECTDDARTLLGCITEYDQRKIHRRHLSEGSTKEVRVLIHQIRSPNLATKLTFFCGGPFTFDLLGL